MLWRLITTGKLHVILDWWWLLIAWHLLGAMSSAVITMVEDGGCLSPEPLRDVIRYSRILVLRSRVTLSKILITDLRKIAFVVICQFVAGGCFYFFIFFIFFCGLVILILCISLKINYWTSTSEMYSIKYGIVGIAGLHKNINYSIKRPILRH